MIKACILDMDGVIVDTEPIQLEAFRRFLNDYHLQVSTEFLDGLVGYSVQDNMADIKKKFFIDKEFDIASAIRRRNEIYLQMIAQQQLSPLPGVLELIDFCQQRKIKLAVASSSDRQQVDTIMNRLVQNYRSVFHAVVTGDDVIHKKPAPDIYLQVVEQLQLPAASCLAFEDSRAGVESAKAAGVICFAVRNRYAEERYLQQADRVIDSILEALDILKAWGIEQGAWRIEHKDEEGTD
ncbi:MAG: HAD family phosphatase [candidate division KSB1 bacterium]|nr:HAD family phosphatase [candidate division KSB1 bacterium]